MLSWLQVKKRDERHKAKRKTKIYDVSHAGKEFIKQIIDGKEEAETKDFRFLEKLRLSIRRSVFR